MHTKDCNPINDFFFKLSCFDFHINIIELVKYNVRCKMREITFDP